MTRIGLVGCGRWGGNILRDLLALGCAVEVADPKVDAGEAGACRSVAAAAQLSADLDGYVVATPTVQHAASVLELAPRGKPIFCEKPLAPDPAAARRMVEACGGRLFVMHKWWYHGGIRALADLVQGGGLGALRELHLRRLQWSNPHDDVDGVWILCVHDLSIAAAILGRIPPARAARGVGRGGRLDRVVGLLGDDPHVCIEAGTGWPRNERMVLATFDDGLALLDDPLAAHIHIHRGPAPQGSFRSLGDWERAPVADEMPLLVELRTFVDHLRGGPPPPTDGEQGIAVVDAIARLRELAQT